jgi:hypothetical protein
VDPGVEGSNPFTHPTSLSDGGIFPPFAPVAQMDRASAFEAAGRGFDSLRARH